MYTKYKIYLQLFVKHIVGLRISILSLDDLGVMPSKPSTGIARKTLSFFWEFRGVFSPVNEFTAPLYRVHP